MKIRSLTKSALFFFLLTSSIFSQGTLKGIVTDSLTNETLFGANVFIPGTALGSASNIEGQYQIPHIPQGKHKIKISYIGYKPKEIEVSIQEDKTTILDISIVPDMILGETVLVTGQALGQAAAINQQRTSNTIINVVSEEKLKELPDANAAESIGRLPGVSVTRSGGEANKIVLRGLSDKYTNVTLDGVRIPSTDALGRGIDLSLISQSSLAGIELIKALTADKDADGVAGSVNLVTKKAPRERELRTVLKGGYNNMMSSVKQYDFSVKYGERFFEDFLGVQFNGNIENRIRSNELSNLNYDQTLLNQTSYFINQFTIQFNDEIRKRNGLSLILDYNTPDEGNIKFNNSYNSTKRDFILHSRDYPNGGGQTQYLGGVTYTYRDREQEIQTFNSALTGENHLLGFDLNWGLSFAQSTSEYPYDYQLDFSEPSNAGTSGMRSAPQFKDQPERLIPFAYNNFIAATLAGAYFTGQNNMDKDKAVFLDLSKQYTIGDNIAGVLKFGGKYKSKNRNNNQTQNFAPYYLGYWQPNEKLPDGTIRQKNLSGTLFDAFYQRYLANSLNNTVSFSEFLDSDPKSRTLDELYELNPLINRDKLREWYNLNKYGIDASGRINEYYTDPTFAAFYYDINETVSSAYIMNTFNLGQSITFIAGVRVEEERNDYKNRYSKQMAGGFPSILLVTRDTTSSYKETVVLPNFHLNIKVTDFMNVRLAAYRALARPDFNMRLNTYFAWRPAAVGGNRQLIVGNPILKTAKAWNYELNTSFYGNEIGLFSISAFYKEFKDMYHMLNQINTTGNVLFDDLGLETRTLHTGSYQLTIPYNSPGLSKVWGFEIEHQMNFTFLPGLLKNIILSYNASIARSETYIIGSRTDTVYTTVPGFPFPVPNYVEVAVHYKQQLENQPKFYGNISLGYDIGGFSGRISLFHQSEYYASFSPSGRSDNVIRGFDRIDIALKQKITNHISLQVDLNNITNFKDDNLLYNRVNDYKVLNISQQYGLTVDAGIRVEL